jgi:hypothetical protein
MLYAFDLIEHDARTSAIGHFSTLKRRWRNCSAMPRRASCSPPAEYGPTVFAHACRLGAEGMVSKKDRARVWSGSRSATPQASWWRQCREEGRR